MFWIRPRFKHHFRVDVVAEEKVVFLLSDQQHFVLKGKTYAALAPLLNGKNSLDEIVAALEGEVAVSSVWHALAELEKKGYITEESDFLNPDQTSFWSALGVDPALAGPKLAEAKVEVIVLGGLSPLPFINLLESMGLTVAAPAEGNLRVVLTDDYLNKELAEINREAQTKDIPWLIVKSTGLEAMAGPVFVPGKTACWECLSARMKGNLKVKQAVDKMEGRQTVIPAVRGFLPAGEQAALSLAALELAKWIVKNETSALVSNLMTLDLSKPEIQFHAVQRLPQCPSCGNSEITEARPLVMESRVKTFVTDGGHRILKPLETYLQYAHLIDPLTGLVSQVIRMRPEESQVHLYFAGENRALYHGRYNLKKLKASLRSSSAGKGMTDAQAKASALCEALERISGVFRGDEPERKKISYRQLGDEAVHLAACQNFSQRQYEQREEINRQEISFYHVPEPFDEEAVLDWTPVWSLTQKRFRYLPTEYCYYNYPEARFALGDSNGNASGNTLEEAVLQGFFELVERDCVALWWYNRLPRPAVDLESFSEPYYGELREEYRRMGRKMWAIDLTSDLGIPTFAAISCRADGTESQVMFGFGTHLDPKIALSRAVTEMNQSLSILDVVNRGQAPLEDTTTLKWLKEATLANQPYLASDPTVPAKQLADYHQPFHQDILEDIEYCRGIIEELGMEMLVLDQTRPDIGMPVVKVIVPGLRHFWARFAPGRLYEVPVKLGWLERENTEDELNPIPMFW
ncbi:bacteriocin biosynthesis cyclodehydratase domain protein [Desulfosporosinus orientis DSM 765]|uniref:Bacteriocin biosynthesis cyclodehydratase domain protein n=1 Tax=Desulfosporosinus orientis (strain ATCC 19365 / DSM 765 / NCIMB 8382 / VKM B-1628 / Singapore I) TaxID=768706 RepID=G7W6U3_DESOD|nr:TOMM precursor leader peptide-binding protein [Desulfosporosinus orientis]AET69225.1 bacteriocin biosynthesis cyclodehydratase domain protein [Desulfosporosinus orientis DSM 765]